MPKPDKRFRRDVASIIPKTKGIKKGRLPSAPAKEPINSSLGVGTAPAASAASTTAEGGIASPLEEVAGTRTYHSNYAVYSPDGLFVMILKPIRSAQFKDNNGKVIDVKYKDPSA